MMVARRPCARTISFFLYFGLGAGAVVKSMRSMEGGVETDADSSGGGSWESGNRGVSLWVGGSTSVELSTESCAVGNIFLLVFVLLMLESKTEV